ncbi:MaoC/PaaZ C-terminal domain-containing protein [Bosea sp. RAC05]|uniref:MaoC/PaaZ C-terminal domain-containing protein n=1 Tax=unclassified Bosea (in: a-proteobacteria) TaxID=2653178 RepID=UPI001495DC70|nr:MaoC/PaaZ C-terminal domain-containing protein [Bosea sp. RAC05]MCZ8043240.1 MaoC/PaaZ C-terminal domain-containing protein [Beijerinckiaceae bacterium]
MDDAMGLYFEDFTDELRVVTRGRTVGEGDITLFSGLSGDFNPLHVDAEYCATTPFGERIAHGPLTLAMAIGLMSQQNLIDATTMGLLDLHWSFSGPVRIGDTVHAIVTTVERKPSRKPDRGVVTLKLAVVNQRGEQVQTGQMKLLMKRRDQDPNRC